MNMFVVSAEFVYFAAKMQKKSLETDYQNILGVWHVVVMMDIEISCKGHCEKLSHFQALVSHTVWVFMALQE